MEQQGFRFGQWQVDVAGNCVTMGDTRAALEPRAMDVLRYLCRHPGAVIPAEELLQTCWGTTELGDNPVHKAIAQLRRALGDSSTEPRYIETVRKRGYRAIAAVVEGDVPDVWRGGSPFRGLAPFQESHAAIFYGRVQATARLHDLVLAQVAGGCPMALVLGPSGSGKTSLVRAGLLPRLMAGGASAGVALACVLQMDCADLGGSGLFGALAAVLVDAERDGTLLFEGSSADTLGRRLRDDTAAVAATLADGGPVRVAVFVDRFEAIFRAPHTSDADRADFTGVLEQLARAGTLVVLACRNDFYPSLIALRELMALKSRGGHFDVEAPAGFDIAQMVRQPASAAQLTFETDPATGASLDDVLCDAARASPDALPLLQYCLDELYRQRGPEGQLRFDVLRRLGGIEGALGVRAEQIVAALPAAQQAALPHVLSLLVDIGEEQSAVTARRPAWSALTSEAQRELVAALVEARLFVSELAGDVPGFGVAHEALLRRWPRVVEWIERHRHALQIRTRVAAQAERWQAAGRPRDLLLPEGMQANQARGLLEIADLSLSAQERQYVDASLRRARLGARIRVAAMGVIALLAVLAAALGLAARSAQDEAEQRRADAESLMSFMLGDFVDKLRPLGRLDLLDDIGAKALPYLSGAGDDGNARLLVQRAKTLKLIAEVNVARGRQPEATRALLAAREILQRQIGVTPADPELLKELGANAYWLGQISFDRSDWPAARKEMLRYRDYGERLVALAPRDPEAWLELSYAHTNVGSVALRSGDLRAAEDAFDHSVALKMRVLAARPDDGGTTVDLANALSWLASTKAKLGALPQAMALYRKEEALLAKVHAATPGNAAWSQRLALALWHQAELLQAMGDARAGDAYAAAQGLLEAIVRHDPSNRGWQKSLYGVQLKALTLQTLAPADVLRRAGTLQGQLRELGAQQPKRLDVQLLLAKSAEVLARAHLRGGDATRAAAALQPALDSYAGLQATARGDASLATGHAIAELLRADIDRTRGEAGWQRGCRNVQQLLAGAGAGTDHAQLALLVQASACLGQGHQAAPLAERLRQMGYRDRRYTDYLTQHPLKKGSAPS